MPEKMNYWQKRAVDFKEGAMLLLAGPGSGKTYVIAHRIRRLVENGVLPQRILVITFTREAAQQMKDRYIALCGGPSSDSQVCFGTFHSIFYNILKTHSSYRSVTPINEKEKYGFLGRAAQISELAEALQDGEEMGLALSLISGCKNNGGKPESYPQERFTSKEFCKLFYAYNELLREFGKIDFDDMINLCLKVLGEDKLMLHKWQNSFEYILIDEFQDISEKQYQLVKLLAYPENNIFAVGDDDQSIYGFRGARVELMHRFASDYPDMSKENLRINYRSTEEIVKTAGIIIKENKERFSKEVQSVRAGGHLVELQSFDSGEKELENILEVIRRDIHRGISAEEIAVLTRTNRQARDIAAYLEAEGIKTSVRDNRVNGFWASPYIRDICAYISIGNGDRSRGSFTRIINRPLRYIKRDALPEENVTEAGLMRVYASDKRMQKAIERMFGQLRRIRLMRPYLAVSYIRNTIGYDNWVKENVSAEKYISYLEEMEAFMQVIKPLGSYMEMEDKIKSLHDRMTEKETTRDKKGVRVMTYHASKGLEFMTVILPDVNEGKIPQKGALNEEEERRLFYVAVTRAKDRLFIFYRRDENRKPSRFIRGLLKHLKA